MKYAHVDPTLSHQVTIINMIRKVELCLTHMPLAQVVIVILGLSILIGSWSF